ncbi:hypothetical protein HDE_13218 [Halotydeus destructor]|nr:hypothetical protein HDE_13218 [Halotydeus destructor]
MPAPYATDCIDYRQLKHDSREACLDECKKGKVLEMYDKIPFTSIVVEPEAKRHMSTVDNDDPEVNEKLWKIDHRCQRLCRKPNCLDSIYVTKFVRSEYDDALDFTVRVYATNEPVVESTFKAKIEFAQFAIQVLSTFGIWFGVSLYSFVDIFEDISEFMTHKAETLADSFSHRKRALKRR